MLIFYLLAMRSDGVRQKGLVVLKGARVALVSTGGGVNRLFNPYPARRHGFRADRDRSDSRSQFQLRLDAARQGRLRPAFDDLTPVAVSDECWFSWKRFHPDAKLETV